MSANLSFLVKLPQWLLRVARSQDTLPFLMNDPMAFAAWYALINDALDWPDAAQAIREAERAKKLPLENMVKLLEQVDYAFEDRLDAAHARKLLEGYAVHEWCVMAQGEFRAMISKALRANDMSQALAALAPSQDEPAEDPAPAAQHGTPPAAESAKKKTRKAAEQDPAAQVVRVQVDVDELLAKNTPFGSLCDCLGLRGLERELLAFALVSSVSPSLGTMLRPFKKSPVSRAKLWSAMFAASSAQLEKALGPNSALRLSGLLQATSAYGSSARLDDFWLTKLLSEETLFDALLEPLKPRSRAGAPARVLKEDEDLARKVVANEPGLPGINVLLYGTAALDKYGVLRAIVEGANKRAWRLRGYEEVPRSVRPSLVYVAQRLLAKQPERDGVLVVDRPADVLAHAPSAFLRMFLGEDFEQDERPFDENLLRANPLPTLWLTFNAQGLPPETVARFVLHVPLKKADRADRRSVLESMLEQFRMTKGAREEVLSLDGVSAEQVHSALKVAQLTGTKTRRERDAVVVQAVRRSQRALSRDVHARMKPSVTQYSLRFLNTAGRFGPPEILACLRRNPKGSLVFYGPPGTGKTQFVEYMATELSLPLVSKKASDLLSKWVGESEKNIAAAFEEAASEDAILFLDEGDSFLRDRMLARDSWQITQVNELLQHIERFEGIVIVATNLFRGLDVAALRRFTFKVEFRELDAEQRWEMFVAETGLKGNLASVERATREAWWERLVFMRGLAAGDFATVKRQCQMLDTQLTPEQWLEQLQLECDVKKPAAKKQQEEGEGAAGA
jgi:hypothetical protein